MTTIRSTFTLHRNDEGNLIGFPEKKPLPEPKPKKQRRLFKRKQGSDQEPKPHEEGKKGIASRIKRIIPLRRKGKEQAASDGSKLSKITGKLKGVIPRRKNK